MSNPNAIWSGALPSRVLQLLKERPRTLAELQRELSVHASGLFNALRSLTDEGVVISRGKGKYEVTSDVRMDPALATVIELVRPLLAARSYTLSAIQNAVPAGALHVQTAIRILRARGEGDILAYQPGKRTAPSPQVKSRASAIAQRLTDSERERLVLEKLVIRGGCATREDLETDLAFLSSRHLTTAIHALRASSAIRLDGFGRYSLALPHLTWRESQALQALKSAPLRKADVARAIGSNRGVANRAVDNLVSKGVVVALTDGRFALPSG